MLQYIVTQTCRLGMELAGYHRPHRAVVRCKAKMQLLEVIEDCGEECESGCDALFEELATTLFESTQYRVFYEKSHSKQEVKDAEDRLAAELAETFLDMLKRRKDPLVQAFNALL